jgi:GntR family transcriptional regulator
MIDPFVTTLSDPETGFGGGEGAWYASEVTASRRKPTTTTPRVEIQQATGVVAAELGLNEGTTVVSRHQQRQIDATPWSLQTTFYPMRFVDIGAARLIHAVDIDQGAVRYLAEELGVKQVGYRDNIVVRAPDSTEATFFRLPSDGRVAVVEILRTGFDEDGAPIRLTVTVFPADRNRFVVNVGKVPNMKASPSSSHDAKISAASDGSPARGS